MQTEVDGREQIGRQNQALRGSIGVHGILQLGPLLRSLEEELLRTHKKLRRWLGSSTLEKDVFQPIWPRGRPNLGLLVVDSVFAIGERD
jgi:hypothetical protein